METLKNFVIGLTAIVLSLAIFGIILLTWPLILGLTSVLLSVLVGILFIVLVFYVIVLVGHTVRRLMKKQM
ncbi:MAG: hypothetical protein ABH869_02900 [Candidatus Omnitrophota bacterium]